MSAFDELVSDLRKLHPVYQGIIIGLSGPLAVLVWWLIFFYELPKEEDLKKP